MMYFSVRLTANRAFGMTSTLTRGNGTIASGNIVDDETPVVVPPRQTQVPAAPDERGSGSSLISKFSDRIDVTVVLVSQ